MGFPKDPHDYHGFATICEDSALLLDLDLDLDLDWIWIWLACGWIRLDLVWILVPYSFHSNHSPLGGPRKSWEVLGSPSFLVGS